MYKLFSILALLLIGCSGPNLAGGTSSSDNAKVMGIVVSSSHEPIAAATITIMNGFDSVGSIQSDAQGKFEIALNKNDSRILFAQNGTSIGRCDVRGNDDSVTIIIQNSGAISLATNEFSLGDTVRMVGVPYSWIINDLNQPLVLSPLPAGPLLPLKVGTTQFTDVAGHIASDDTLEVAVNAASVKPVWKFPLTIAVNERVVAHAGTLNLFRDSLEMHLRLMERVLNTPEINGIFQFPIDSIYQFSGSIASQEQGSVAPSVYRWIFSDTNDTRSRSVIRFDYIWSYSTNYAFFTPSQVTIHAALFAEARGAFNLTDIAVPAGTIPVHYPALSMEPSLMYGAATSSIDPYTAAVLNFNAGTIGTERDIIHQGQVDSLLVAVVDENGVPQRNQRVTLYGVKIDELTPDTIPIATAETSAEGVAPFTNNPLLFMGKLTYSAVLLTCNSGEKTGAEWFTVYQSGMAWFDKKRAVQTRIVLK